MIVHPIPPLFDENSKTLILGSFPSVKSRESAFFYGHKQNRFWQVVANIFGEKIPQTIEEKKQLILANNLALWDVIGKCEIEGSADSTIKNVTANDLTIILNNAPIERIFVNGKTALKYYDKYIKPLINRSAILLPSTSPANAVYSIDNLIKEWKIIKN
ncbi:MAG: DNA-deoxyinosine glycosylase [Clostridiales bacterium]|nr:DNA-deoxyinosine glycosylase [Clostridiales bacterium]